MTRKGSFAWLLNKFHVGITWNGHELNICTPAASHLTHHFSTTSSFNWNKTADLLEVFHVLVGQHGTQAGHRNFQEHVHHSCDRNATASAVTLSSQHVDTHGEHHLSGSLAPRVANQEEIYTAHRSIHIISY